MGLAQADNLLAHPQRARRAAAWHAIQAAWGGAGDGGRHPQRHQRLAQRADPPAWQGTQVGCLDRHQGHLDRVTLETPDGGVPASTRSWGDEPCAPWPAPSRSATSPLGSYAPAPAAASVLSVSSRRWPWWPTPSPALTPRWAFARMMAANGWIDAAPSEQRRSGAYSTEYADPPEPRVFLTFEGTLDNVITLAHELGHAWHSWLLRELPLSSVTTPRRWRRPPPCLPRRWCAMPCWRPPTTWSSAGPSPGWTGARRQPAARRAGPLYLRAGPGGGAGAGLRGPASCGR